MALGSQVTIKAVRGHPRYKWRANFIEEGKRKQKYFATKREAEIWSENRADESLEFGTGSSVSAEERSAVIETREKLAEVGWDIRGAIEFAAKAKDHLAAFDVEPESALEFVIDYYKRTQRSISIDELANEVETAKKNAGRSKRHSRDMEYKLKKFRESFGSRSAATLESREIEDWLHGLKLTPGSVNSYRRVLNLTFNHAVKRGYCAANPVSAIDRVTEAAGEPETLSVEEIAALLTNADDRILPAFAIAAFAGLRSSEIEGTIDHEGLDWSQIDFEEGTILVRADIAKGRSKRHVPISDNLQVWLFPLAKRKGKVWPANGRKLHEATRRKAGFGTPGSETPQEKEKSIKLRQWPKNALRHSYASYHLATHLNAAELVINMGHSDDAATVFNHYRGIVKPNQAKAFWSIMPEKAENVISIAS